MTTEIEDAADFFSRVRDIYKTFQNFQLMDRELEKLVAREFKTDYHKDLSWIERVEDIERVPKW
jgi:hypothetical protein